MKPTIPRRDFSRQTVFVQSPTEAVLLALSLAIVAWLLYTSYIGAYYVSASAAIRQSSGIQILMGSDALLPAGFTDDTLEKRQLLVYRLLIMNELLDAETTREELEKKDHPGYLAYAALAGVKGDSRSWKDSVWDSHTLDLIVHLAQTLGVPERGHLSREEVRRLTAEVLSSVLARQQGATDAWVAEVRKTGANEIATGAQEEPLKQLANRAGSRAPWSSGFVLFPESGLDGDQVIQTLFQQFKVVEAYNPFEPGNAKSSNEVEQMRVVALLMKKLLATIEEDQKVKTARTWLSVLQGPEQMCSIFIGLLLMTLILLRHSLARYEADQLAIWTSGSAPSLPAVELFRVLLPKSLSAYFAILAALGTVWFVAPNTGYRLLVAMMVLVLTVELRLIYLLDRGFVLYARELILQGTVETDVRDFVKEQGHVARQSRWLLQFLKIALGGIGFFGTCRGLMLALPLVPDIVAQARTPHELSAAFRDVTTTLSLSMTTTLVALALTLAIDPFERKQAAQESVFFNRLYTALGKLCSTTVFPPPEPESSPDHTPAILPSAAHISKRERVSV